MPDRVKLGRFRLQRRLGEGASGLVFLAVHEPSGHEVAVKVLRPERALAARSLERFEQEIRAVARLDHRGIIRFLDHGIVDGRASKESGDYLSPGSPWLAMELARGPSLGARLARGVGFDDVADLARALLSALAHAHARGIVHGDLKPENVLVRSPSDSLADVVLTDLGLSGLWTARAGEARRGDRCCGTPGYMAPEQLAGSAEIGPEADLYALGALLWSAICGSLPFGNDLPGSPLARLVAHLPPLRPRPGVQPPPGTLDFLAGLLAGSPRDRFASAAEAARALDAVTRGVAPPPPRGEFPAPPPDWRILDGPRPGAGHAAGLSLLDLRPPPLCGQEGLRDRLWAALGDAARGKGARIVLLTGLQGVGKSRLARWLCELAEEYGYGRAAIARYPDEGGPFDGLRGALARLLRVGGRRGDSLVSHLAAHLGGLSRTDACALASWLRPGSCAEGGAALATAEERWSLVRGVLAMEASHCPVVLWMDDVHHSTEGFELLRLLAADPARAPRLVVVATTRSSDALGAEDPRLEAARRLSGIDHGEVLPLGRADVRDVARGVVPLARGLADRIAEASEGNPLFAIQVVEELAARDELRPVADGFEAKGTVEIPLPRGLLEALSRRVDVACPPLPSEERSALHLLAVLAARPDRREWTAAMGAAGLPVERAPDLWHVCAEAGLLEPHGAQQAAFAHGLVRTLLMREAEASGSRPRLEAACAEALSGLHPDPDRWVRARIGRHRLAAGDVEAGLAALLDAAWSFHSAGDYAQEEEILADARADARGRDGRPPHPAADLLAMREAGIRRRDGDRRAVEATARDVLSRVRPDTEPGSWERRARTEALRALGIAILEKGEADASLPLLEASLAEYRAEEDPRGSAAVLRALGHAHLLRGDVSGAEATFRLAEEEFARAGDRVGCAQASWSRALALVYRGEIQRAEALFREARDAFRQAGSRLGEAESANGLGDALRHMGRLDEAEVAYREALEGLEGLRSPHASLVQANLGLISLLRGDPGGARPWLDSARAALERQGRDRLSGLVACALALAAALSSDADTAEAELRRATALFGGRPPADPDLARLLRTLAERLSALGRTDLATLARGIEPPGVA